MRKATQKDLVLAHLKSHGKINTGYAIAQLGITRLAAVIWGLKQDGYLIDTKRAKRRGDFATYTLKKKEESNNDARGE